ncbi:hypothetical protein GQ600_21581 [Phytophthora cactorum]|nr:hypothetical protein GQ600_21581 [Phytophthora cactorum]
MEPAEDAPMLGVGSDAVLAALATIVRKPKSKRRRTTTTNSTTTTTVEFPLETTDLPARDVTMLDTVVPTVLRKTRKSSTAINNPIPAPAVATRTKFPSTDCPSDADPLMLDIGSDAVLATLATVMRKPKSKPAALSRKQSAVTISPSANPIQMPNLVDLTESTPPPRADTNLTLVARRQEMAEHRRYNQDHTMANVTTEWVEHDKAKWPVSKAVVEIAKVLPDIHFTDPEIDKAADTMGIPPTTFNHIRTEFNGDIREERELVKYVKEATMTIKIGVDMLDHEEIIREIGAAVGRGVVVQLFIDFKKACDEGLAWVKELLEAGVKVCHSTEKFEWKAAIFDNQILELNMDYTIVQTGSIVSAFEYQFDKMWKAASKKVTKRARTAAKTDLSDSEESSEMEPGKKRKLGKITCFPTTLPFLEMMGL